MSRGEGDNYLSGTDIFGKLGRLSDAQHDIRVSVSKSDKRDVSLSDVLAAQNEGVCLSLQHGPVTIVCFPLHADKHSCLLSCFQQTPRNVSMSPSHSATLGIHVMDALGFREKSKMGYIATVSVRTDAGIVSSACTDPSAHARHMIWDAELYLSIDIPSTDSNDVFCATLCHTESDTPEAVGEKRLWDLIEPLVHRSSTAPGRQRQEIVMKLHRGVEETLTAENTEEIRLRIGVILSEEGGSAQEYHYSLSNTYRSNFNDASTPSFIQSGYNIF